MTSRVVLVVSEDSQDERLDHFLGTHAPDLSRTRAKEIIVSGLATLNGKRAKPSTRVVSGDRIEAEVSELEHLSADPEDIPLDIVYEDDDIIVVDKPMGMVVHPAPGSRSGTLVNALLGRGLSLSGLGGSLRPGIVHRLDRNTSGLIVVAKNDVAHRTLSGLFEAREIGKQYLTIVWGTFDEPEGVIDAPIGRRTTDRTRMGVRETGRTAITGWTVREEFPFATFLSIDLRTGRTHQIRVHMSHYHHPVVGDMDYGGVRRSLADVSPHYRPQAKYINEAAERQALFSRRLAFRHPKTEKQLEFVAPMPDDFAGLLSRLRYPDGERGRVIGIDPGEVRVGVAASDESRFLASSIETIHRENDAAVAHRIAELAAEREADTIVVGYPIRMDGSIGPRAVRSRELAVVLEDVCRCRVVLWDERLSSVEAQRIMHESGERTRRKKGRIDQIAASIILQSYLDSAGRDAA
ncbi:Holliday junction resolvase RuvX [bacterium]|nr:Holliday junction resolvase RuvX [bacterium]